MPSTLSVQCASCGESAAVLNGAQRPIERLACPACGERGRLRPDILPDLDLDAATGSFPFAALAAEPIRPAVSARSILARRKRGSGLAFLVRMAIVVALGGLLAHWVWQQVGTPRVEIHKDLDGSVREIRVVPMQ